MYEYKEYIPTEIETQFIKFSISFNYDTYNWATGQPKEKGYQLTATPVEKTDMVESFTAFSGFYKIIFPAERKSKKRLEEAIRIFKRDRVDYIDYFRELGYKIKDI
jgi:ribonucleotide reductase beta subunit family protein with ferritin-like domain